MFSLKKTCVIYNDISCKYSLNWATVITWSHLDIQVMKDR